MQTKEQPQLIDAGSLNRRVQIQSQISGQASDGSILQTWTTVYTGWANVDVQRSQLINATAEFVSKATHRTSSIVIQPNMRAVYTEATTGVVHTYNVEAILNPEQRNTRHPGL